MLGNALVSLKSKKQRIVATSSAESKYRGLASAAKELLWVFFVLKDLLVPYSLLVILFTDNKAAQALAQHPCYHGGTKHIAIDVHFICDHIHSGFLEVYYVPSSLQLADFLTKVALHNGFYFLAPS